MNKRRLKRSAFWPLSVAVALVAATAQAQAEALQLPTTAAPADRPPRRSPALMIVGAGMFVGAYGFGVVIAGLRQMGDGEPCGMTGNCNRGDPFAGRLLIPLAGPWLAMHYAEGDNYGHWPLIVLGLTQASGLVLATIGMIRFFSFPASTADPASARVGVGVAPLPGGAYAHARWQL